MWEFVRRIFDTSDFPARWHCGRWSSAHGWTHILSDIAVWLAYATIPMVLVYFTVRRHDLPFRKIFLLFGAFILACGSTHLMEAVIFWWPAYRLAAAIKLTTALVSWATVVALCFSIPRMMATRSPVVLERELSDHRQAELGFRQTQVELEQRVAEEASRVATAKASLQLEVAEREKAQERFRLAVESCPNGMIMVNRAGAILLVNAETERMFGYPRAELVGQSVDMLVPIGLRDKHPQHRQQFMAQPQVRAMGAGRDLFGRRKDGSEFPVEIGLNPIDSNEGPMVLAAVADITARKKADEGLRRFALQLQRSNRELQDFAYVASHDLQEPLRKIQAFGDRLKSQCGQTLSDEGRDYVERMNKAATRMRSLIDDLLRFSRVATRALPWARVDLNHVVRDVVENLRQRIDECRGRVAVDPLPTIDADSIQMQQLFTNILGNALKFRRSDVAPSIRVRCELIANGRPAARGNTCRITIEDNGVGFDDQYAERIFEMFQRLNDRTQYEGSGIGLAICRKIVERHGGRIKAHGRVNHGATFVITLPVSQTTREEMEESPCRPAVEASSC